MTIEALAILEVLLITPRVFGDPRVFSGGLESQQLCGSRPRSRVSVGGSSQMPSMPFNNDV